MRPANCRSLPLKKLATGLFTAFVLMVAGEVARAEQAPLYTQVMRSTAWVLTPTGDHQYESGTGSLIDARQRLLLTNHHVVGEVKQVQVYFPFYYQNRQLVTSAKYYRQYLQSVPGEVVAVDVKRDLALVRLAWIPPGVVPLPLAAHGPWANDPVHGIGNSHAGKHMEGELFNYATTLATDVEFIRTTEYGDLGNAQIETLMVITPKTFDHGDSGGPAVNERGELAGVITGATEKNNILIDVSEVKMFLDEVNHVPQPAGFTSVGGNWRASFTVKGDEKILSVTFRPDGTCTLAGGKVLQGKYTLNKDAFTLTLDGMKSAEAGKIAWESNDRFTFTTPATKYTFTRR